MSAKLLGETPAPFVNPSCIIMGMRDGFKRVGVRSRRSVQSVDGGSVNTMRQTRTMINNLNYFI